MTDNRSSPSTRRVHLNVWTLGALVILLLALTTRLYALGHRAVSHDETTHARYSWNIYTGQGFRHDPLMHGPLLFEATAFFYALFGVSDFTARLYTALAGIVLVMTPWLFQRWLGRLGALLTSLLLLISPYITYYSRYTRHDIPIILFTVLLLWTVLRYLEEGRVRWLNWMGIFFALMYASKENAYIYTAIFMVLLSVPWLWQFLHRRWERPELAPVLVGLLVVVLVAGGAFLISLPETEIVPEGEAGTAIRGAVVPVWGRLGMGVAVASAFALLVVTTHAVGGAAMRSLRLFDVLMVLGTFTLPLGSALLMETVAGVNMARFYPALMTRNFAGVPGGELLGAGLILALSLGGAVALGLWWDRRRWPLIALLHYAVFGLLFSTLLTYGWGVLTGLVGGLAYWIAQQEVQRGSQPWYYYGLVGPLYEYLPVLVSLIGGAWLIRRGVRPADVRAGSDAGARQDGGSEALLRFLPYFLLAWAGLSWIAYAVAGEKMPWLFVHIALPHIWLAGLVLDRAFGHLTWRDLLENRAWLIPVSLIFLALAWLAFYTASGGLPGLLLAEPLALTFAQLLVLGRLIGGILGLLIFTGLLLSGLNSVGLRRGGQLGVLTLVLLLGGLTLRTSVMANYLNDELATEYLVYAHSTPDVNEALAKIDRLSWRLTGTSDQIRVAYSRDVAWPLYWYMYKRYPNHVYFETPDERLLDSPVILAASSEWAAVEQVLGDRYDAIDYKHIWWPIEDYKGLTWERIRAVLTEPERRQALWDIVWKRDYRRYARLRNPEAPFTFATWPHRSEFRLYLQSDVAAQMWDYRLQDGQIVSQAAVGLPGVLPGDDPYAEAARSAPAVVLADLPGSEPRGVAVAPDGTVYVADAGTHRIWQLGPEGEARSLWGGLGVAAGQFNAPWDVAADAEGNLYVADTWNHRLQKLDAQGRPLLSWGRFAQVGAYDPTGYGAFFGPRGVAVGPEGDVYVTDTGNHRVQVFDGEGQFLRAFNGDDGPAPLREPVGIAAAATGEVFVADSWGRRVQVFSPDGRYLRDWDVPIWLGLGLQDRPFLAVLGDTVLVTDPVHERIVVFDRLGQLQDALQPVPLPLLPGGIAPAADGGVLVSDLRGEALVVLSPAP